MQNAPGVTDKEVLIGTTTPLSGAASAYAPVSKGATAYFNYLNDKTSGDNQFPVTQEALQPWQNGASPPGWVVDKNIISAR